jgi:hypothetical protein
MTTTSELDSATGVTVLGYNRYNLEAVKDKFCENLAKIENLLNLNIESTYTLVDDKFTIHAVHDTTLTPFTYDCLKRTTDIGFRCSQFSFILPEPSKSVLNVVFDRCFNINYVEFKSMTKNGFGYSKIELVFNKDLALESIIFRPSTYRTDVDLIEIKKGKLVLPLADEVLLFKLYCTRGDDVKQLLPEYYIPSAYDFNSVEFADRLKVYSMLTL